MAMKDFIVSFTLTMLFIALVGCIFILFGAVLPIPIVGPG